MPVCPPHTHTHLVKANSTTQISRLSVAAAVAMRLLQIHWKRSALLLKAKIWLTCDAEHRVSSENMLSSRRRREHAAARLCSGNNDSEARGEKKGRRWSHGTERQESVHQIANILKTLQKMGSNLPSYNIHVPYVYWKSYYCNYSFSPYWLERAPFLKRFQCKRWETKSPEASY